MEAGSGVDRAVVMHNTFLRAPTPPDPRTTSATDAFQKIADDVHLRLAR